MKSVSGKVVSTKPISLSKAAKVIYNFVDVETGALRAVSTYLKRFSLSFNDLVGFHKELKPSRSDRNHNKHRSERANNGNAIVSEQNSKEAKLSRNVEENVGNREKKKEKRRADNLERESGGDLGVVERERKGKKKKRKSGEIDDGGC